MNAESMQDDQDNRTKVNHRQPGFSYSLLSESGEAYEIDHVVTVGRTITNDIYLLSRKISRKHAFLDVVNNVLQVKDLDSSNGTFVNGQRISEVTTLKHDDLVQFDDIKFKVCVGLPSPLKSTPTQQKQSNQNEVVDMTKDDSIAENNIKQTKIKIDHVATQKPIEIEASKENKLAEKSTNNIKKPVSLPGSWVEGGKAVEGTRMLNADQLKALREGVTLQPNNSTEKSTHDNTSNHCQLHCKVDDQSNKIVDLIIKNSSDAQVWELGRDAKCNVVLDHPSVSSRHAQLIHNNGKWKIVNLVSTNGILINGEKKLSAFLGDGDKIDLGTCSLLFKIPNSQLNKPNMTEHHIKQKDNHLLLYVSLSVLVMILVLLVIYIIG